jgi:phage-related protein
MWEGFKAGWNDYFGSGGKGLFALLGDAFSGAVDGVLGLLGIHSPSTVFEGIAKNLVLGLMKGFNDNWKTFITNVTNFVSNIPKMFANLPAAMVQIGSNLLISLGNGFVNAIGGVLDRVRNVGMSIVNAAKSVFGIASPSKVFTEIGRFIDEGLADGIMDGLSMIEDAADDMTDAVYGDDIFRDQDMQVVTTTSKSDDEPPTDSLIPTQGEDSRDIVVVLELDGVEVGRTVAPYINRESRRVGVQLAGGLA